MRYLVILLVFFFCSSCEKVQKDVNDYYPIVQHQSIKRNADGSIELTATVESKVSAEIEYAGYCISTDSILRMIDNQALGKVIGGEYNVKYEDLEPFTKYYFRPWAANKYGYTLGDIGMVDSISTEPFTFPCSYTQNTISIANNVFENVTNVTYSSNGAQGATINVTSNSINFFMDFDTDLKHAIYTEGYGVVCYFYSGFTSAGLTDESTIYVQRLTSTTWEVVICDATWPFTSSASGHLKAHFLVEG
jgi:hypothetical protein